MNSTYTSCHNTLVVPPSLPHKEQSFWYKNATNASKFITPNFSSKFDFDIVSLSKSQPQPRETLAAKVAKLSEFFSTVSTVDDVLDISKRDFPSQKQYLFDILSEVMKDFYSEEDNAPISIDSLKGMLLFLFSLKKFKEPTISISDSGAFYIDWEKKLNDSLTIRFKSNFILEYSLFQPSLHTNKLAIRNGRLHVLDFEADIYKLNIKTYK